FGMARPAPRSTLFPYTTLSDLRATMPSMTTSAVAADSQHVEHLVDLRRAVEHALEGKPRAVELALIALLTRGHVLIEDVPGVGKDRKSTRLNSSHVKISYAVFC